jgi:hypothetical protein
MTEASVAAAVASNFHQIRSKAKIAFKGLMS